MSGRDEPTLCVVVTGNIAAGKTTAVEALAPRLGFQPHCERLEENPFFTDFTRDPARWTFHSQVTFTTLMLESELAIGRDGHPALLERGIRDMVDIFATHQHQTGILDEREFRVLQALVDIVLPVLPPPALVVHLTAPVPELKRRIVARGRPQEQAIGEPYLAALERLYRARARRWLRDHTIHIDTHAVDLREESGVVQALDAVQHALDRL
jgi:deoxyadenosine/deoxycytidine kinase